ncbi:hypothetical protein SAMN06265365_1425 [Tistlia consotensis]|uniref:Uncharacterized protein n=1 Tax=Tistlia consotensis USBA 355 TaxID=560819 RepID=A0A1Y6CVC4_9PROT|nr:hypothetical protein [Tistlia consotensis]SMF81967.1 hypothetical protein SAMN05428998_1455 [Tistlia consotensis USBA 355]SNS24937.1 hypothetical protein SAMN06265365_1425 [Tistlia consotensis]
MTTRSRTTAVRFVAFRPLAADHGARGLRGRRRRSGRRGPWRRLRLPAAGFAVTLAVLASNSVTVQAFFGGLGQIVNDPTNRIELVAMQSLQSDQLQRLFELLTSTDRLRSAVGAEGPIGSLFKFADLLPGGVASWTDLVASQRATPTAAATVAAMNRLVDGSPRSPEALRAVLDQAIGSVVGEAGQLLGGKASGLLSGAGQVVTLAAAAPYSAIPDDLAGDLPADLFDSAGSAIAFSAATYAPAAQPRTYEGQVEVAQRLRRELSMAAVDAHGLALNGLQASSLAASRLDGLRKAGAEATDLRGQMASLQDALILLIEEQVATRALVAAQLRLEAARELQRQPAESLAAETK